MPSYGRNFDMRVSPQGGARSGRFVSPATALSGAASAGGGSAGTGLIPIGAPVVADLAAGKDAQGRQIVKLATENAVGPYDDASATVTTGLAGILVYEYGPAAFAGDDPYLTTYSDKSVAPLNSGVQVISGDPRAKFVFRNTVAGLFLGVRSYPGRVMVASAFAATPVATVGQYLIPGAGDDTDGYWNVTNTESGAWLVITSVDNLRLEVEARMLF